MLVQGVELQGTIGGVNEEMKTIWWVWTRSLVGLLVIVGCTELVLFVKDLNLTFFKYLQLKYYGPTPLTQQVEKVTRRSLVCEAAFSKKAELKAKIARHAEKRQPGITSIWRGLDEEGRSRVAG
ncbi:hypothetical protein C5167_029484 [Papaver somniferum]|nr:hypothetical protein C5167_029484 [Papaver somniferum]